MKPRLKFSLKSIFVLTTLAAIGVYWIPFTNEVTCDFRGSVYTVGASGNDRIDIQGRNNTQSFETVIENVQLISVDPSNDSRLGRWQIRFRSNLHNRLKLKKYEIIRFQHSKNGL